MACASGLDLRYETAGKWGCYLDIGNNLEEKTPPVEIFQSGGFFVVSRILLHDVSHVFMLAKCL